MAVDSALVTAPDDAALAAEVVVKGDLAKLTETQRLSYITAVCRSLGLNPLTRPFELIHLNGKLTLYATKGATDQLRNLRGVTVTNLEPREIGDLYVVTVSGRDREGREDVSTGAVAIKGLTGESLANAMMKAETKAKRRLTLSLAGLGFPDESEIESIPSGGPVSTEPRLSLAERAAARAAQVAESVDEPATDVAATDAPPEAERPAPAVPEPHGAICLVVSPYGDGAACGLPADHLTDPKAAKLHRAVSAEGEITGSWPV